MNIQPLTHEQKLATTAMILKTGKALAPDRFPKASHETTTMWAGSLDYLYYKFPFPEMWREAVLYWSMELVGEWMVTPSDIRKAVHAVRDRWEKDPQRAPMLHEWREIRANSPLGQITKGMFKCL